MKTTQLLSVLFVGIGTTLAACTVTNNSTTSSSSGGGGDGGTPTDAASLASDASASLDCIALIKCINACPATDGGADPCGDGCIASSSPEAQNDVVALVTCVNKYACKDATCAKANCLNELQTCAKQSAAATAPSGGTPLEGGPPPPTGAFPADLVNNWLITHLDGGVEMDLGADGSLSWVALVENNYGCYSKISVAKYGTAQVSGDQITLYFTSGTTNSVTCDVVDPPSPVSPTSSTYRWQRTVSQYTSKQELLLWDIPAKSSPAFSFSTK
jgi:hypothetical protein